MKARRAALREAREAPRHHGASFTFFDAGDDHTFVGFQDQGSTRVHPEPELARAAEPPPEVKDSPAVQRLDRIRRADRQGSPEDIAPDPSSTPAVGETPQPPPPSPDVQSIAADDQITFETYTPDATAPARHEPTTAAVPQNEAPDLGSEAATPVGYAPPPWEALAAPSDLAQMDAGPAADTTTPGTSTPSTTTPSTADADLGSGAGLEDLPFDDQPLGDPGFDSGPPRHATPTPDQQASTVPAFDDEPAEFRKPRPFVTAARTTAPVAPAAAAADAPAAEVAQPPNMANQVDPSTPAETGATLAEPASGPIGGQPSATPPAEFAIAQTAGVEPSEPVQIHDDPWSRTGPEVVSTAPLPRRRPDPKPSEDKSSSAPDWTKAKLPKFD